MFDTLAARLQDIFGQLRGEVRLTETGIDAALKQIRLALLEADVNFKVVKAFVDRVRGRALDQSVLRTLTPAQHVVRIVRDEMLVLFGDTAGGLPPGGRTPRVIMLLGLQGSGKTTTAAKLGVWLSRQARHPLLVSTDLRRPAAIEQLEVLGAQRGLRVHRRPGVTDPIVLAQEAVADARRMGFDVVIVDTAGRLHIDDELMTELSAIKTAVEPVDLLYVADAMTGQDAVKSAGEFNRAVGVTGVILTKVDGDARGGAALSVVSVVGAPIAFVGSGERLDDLEPFHADRFVSRILGMGDVLSLIEKAERAIERDEAVRLQEKLRNDDLTLEDFRDQLQAIRRMGPLEQILGMLPGFGNVKRIAGADVDERQIKRIEAIIGSMTRQERRHQHIINGSRRKRIASGSGTSVEEVNRLLRQFVQMRRMLKLAGGGGGGGRKRTLLQLRQRLMAR